jgi:hypothetical protein
MPIYDLCIPKEGFHEHFGGFTMKPGGNCFRKRGGILHQYVGEGLVIDVLYPMLCQMTS